MNDRNPFVSVYITNHNYGHFIKKAIESVLSQSMSDF
jgi:glycosyltransferase involved in cell wall biosynthesis